MNTRFCLLALIVALSASSANAATGAPGSSNGTVATTIAKGPSATVPGSIADGGLDAPGSAGELILDDPTIRQTIGVVGGDSPCGRPTGLSQGMTPPPRAEPITRSNQGTGRGCQLQAGGNECPAPSDVIGTVYTPGPNGSPFGLTVLIRLPNGAIEVVETHVTAQDGPAAISAGLVKLGGIISSRYPKCRQVTLPNHGAAQAIIGPSVMLKF